MIVQNRGWHKIKIWCTCTITMIAATIGGASTTDSKIPLIMSQMKSQNVCWERTREKNNINTWGNEDIKLLSAPKHHKLTRFKHINIFLYVRIKCSNAPQVNKIQIHPYVYLLYVHKRKCRNWKLKTDLVKPVSSLNNKSRVQREWQVCDLYCIKYVLGNHIDIKNWIARRENIDRQWTRVNIEVTARCHGSIQKELLINQSKEIRILIDARLNKTNAPYVIIG